MTTRIAINGFGRIGRAAFRIIQQRQAAGNTDLQVVAINDLTDDATLAHLLKYDSVHGRQSIDIKAVDGGIQVGDQLIRTSAEPDPKKLPWKSLEVDVVLESTGFFLDRDK